MGFCNAAEQPVSLYCGWLAVRLVLLGAGVACSALAMGMAVCYTPPQTATTRPMILTCDICSGAA